jgi:MFS family permease
MVGRPGRTQGLGLITEPLIRDLNVSRVDYAQINLVATLLGALFCLGVGKWIDRYGSRIVLTSVVTALGVVVLVMSRVTSVAALFVVITLTRGVGQSALSIVSLAMVGKWFRRRLTKAMAIYALAMSVGFMIAFPAVGASSGMGWRVAWGGLGPCLRRPHRSPGWSIRPRPTSARCRRRRPRECRAPVVRFGRPLDDAAVAGVPVVARQRRLRPHRLRNWLFNESILAQRALRPTYSALAVTAITGLAGNAAAPSPITARCARVLAALAILSAGRSGVQPLTTVGHVICSGRDAHGGGFDGRVLQFLGPRLRATELGRVGRAGMTASASAVGPCCACRLMRPIVRAAFTTGGLRRAARVAAAVVRCRQARRAWCRRCTRRPFATAGYCARTWRSTSVSPRRPPRSPAPFSSATGARQSPTWCSNVRAAPIS